MTSELAPPLLANTPHHGRTFELSTDLTCNAPHTRRVFSGTGLKLVTRPATIRCLDHWATTAPDAMKACFVEALDQVKFVEAQSLHVYARWKLGLRYGLICGFRPLTVAQHYKVRRQ
ncbi:hypothetical protein TNCV_302481 [Trichonephila clavipes]|nr:hypothetical protein TNCV_302481 [Trichonephila clavipes]